MKVPEDRSMTEQYEAMCNLIVTKLQERGDAVVQVLGMATLGQFYTLNYNLICAVFQEILTERNYALSHLQVGIGIERYVIAKLETHNG